MKSADFGVSDAFRSVVSRRSVVGGLVTGGGLALIGEPSALAAPGVTSRRFVNASAIVLPERGKATPYPSRINVSGFKQGKILSVKVMLRGFSHDFPRDVDIMLQAPGGRRIILMSDVGGTRPVSRLSLTFSDGARTTVPQYARLHSGSFRPTNAEDAPDPFPRPGKRTDASSLSTFRGINPNGIWKLFIVDDWIRDSGIVTGGWALRIRATASS